jgi:SAM-dependent methyltransferase
MGLEIVRDPERERTAPLEADWIRRALALRPGDRLLDIPCGSGRIARQLAEAGVRVLGIDQNPELIEEARRRCTGMTPPPVFRVGDMLKLDEPPNYDATIVWWGSFGYFSDVQNVDFVRRAVASLRPGGCLLIDTINREHVRRYALGRHEIHYDELRIVHTVRWEDRTERAEGEWEISGPQGVHRLHSSIRLYTPGQMQGLAQEAGLGEIELFGDWTGNPYCRGSIRLVLRGRRPTSRSRG